MNEELNNKPPRKPFKLSDIALVRSVKTKYQNSVNSVHNSKYYQKSQKYFGVAAFVTFFLSWFLAFIIYAGVHKWDFGLAANEVFVKILIGNFLGIGAILIGVLIAVGYKLSGRSWTDTILGFIKGVIGVLILGFGSGLLIGTARPIFLALSLIGNNSSGNITPLDPYFGLSSTQAFFKAFDLSFVSVIYLALVIGFAWNLLLVAFKKWTNLRSIFVTGHIMLQQAAIFSVMIYLLMFAANGISGSAAFWGTAFMAGLAAGTYWVFGSSLTYYSTQKVTDNAGFAVGHQQMIAISLAWKVGKYFGRAEKSAENIRLSSWFRIFEDNIFTQTVIIFIIFLILVIVIQATGSAGNGTLSNDTRFFYYDSSAGTYVVNTAHTFTLNGQSGDFKAWSAGTGVFWFISFIIGVIKIVASILVIVYGVRTFVTELQQSFTGISERLIPNSSVGVDIAATYGYSPNSVTIGFISGTIGQFLTVAIMFGIKSAAKLDHFPILLPIFITLFFNSGAIGIYANSSGGYKAAIFVPFLFAVASIIVSTFSIWAVNTAFATISTSAHNGLTHGQKLISPFSVGYNGMADPNFFFGIFNALLSINKSFSFVVWFLWVFVLLVLSQLLKYHDDEPQTWLRRKLFRNEHAHENLVDQRLNPSFPG